ncbi:GNAT family N-acetyltransferase [Deinococcus budaensis]|uniref:GNAT superfamily N-acetyltransferase n=1 Tax=Deinococcus budaensis TaxID=1665626 RepID=A0A7W8GID4_9DEIO|nr:GNAT family N-acetyltransferase [Deinococcus budaensis]MBB5236202.1 GNAT superfamily N-acetyltransferase [Deinococcus budaensis]
MSLTLTPVGGDELRAALPDLARLRTEVFRDFPYLYQGSAGYEERYLQTYLEAPGALLLLVRDGAEVVGASTALPLIHETADLQRPFLASEFGPAQVLYLGESVLRSGYRGRGLGHRFFDEREAHARRLGLPVTAFCAVQRPADHPARPRDYRPLDPFWKARGYLERPDLETTLSWQDLGEAGETPKPMRFWVRRA